VNPRAHNGQTPLGLAATFGQRRTIHALMKAGANPKYRTKIGLSPSNYATNKATRNTVKTSRAATKWLAMVRKRRAERMLLSPRLLGSTPLNNKSIANIARYLTVMKKKNSR
jgi:ankyrin repeat protein